MMELLYKDMTGDILAAFRAVRKVYRDRRYSEVAYCRALAIELRNRGHQVQEQRRVNRRYKGATVGVSYIDLVVNQLVAVEVKVTPTLTDEHRSQLQTYMIDGGYAVGMLLTFGADTNDANRPYARLFEKRNAPPGTEKC